MLVSAGLILDVAEVATVAARSVPTQVQPAGGVGPQGAHPPPAQGHHH